MLAAVVDIRRWLETDRQTPFAERLSRDRAIGRNLAATGELSRVLAWWRQVREVEPARAAGIGQGARIERLRRTAVVALGLVGILLGAGTAGVAFAYDGRHPVNLFRLLALLVAVPGILLAGTVLLLAVRGPRPGRAGVLAALDAGRWAGAVLDRAGRMELFAPIAGAPVGVAAFARWQMLVFSQWVAVGFFAGALGLAFLLVVFTDLAFGWSTTLNLATADVQRVFSLLAAPWASWLPAAAPDLALTELSRYFRGEAPVLSSARAGRLGAWWPFVLMAVGVYGMLPRVVLLGCAGWRLRGATRALLLGDPEVTALLDRLAAPVVAPGGDGSGQAPLPQVRAKSAPARAEPAAPALLVIWNQALGAPAARDWLAAALQVHVTAVRELGALDSDTELRTALAELAATGRRAAAPRVIVLTRGWEPPLLEFGDFLGLVRELTGAEASITVVPIDVTGTRVDPADRAVWAGMLGRLRDPRLYVQDPLP